MNFITGCALDGLEKLIDTNAIRFISKISGGRVSVYLSSEAQVNEVSNKKVYVNNNALIIRPLLEKNRVVISNVCPVIPHEIIKNVLKNQGISVVSQMHYIKASTSKPGRSHFRRQIYILEENKNKLPVPSHLPSHIRRYYLLDLFQYQLDSVFCLRQKWSPCPPMP